MTGRETIIDQDYLRRLCQRLVSHPSPSGQEDAVTEEIRRAMRELGYEDVMVDSYGNVTGVIHGTGDGVVVFDGHTDTVGIGNHDAWTSDPFTLTDRDGHLYGRGIADMKGAIAAMLTGIATLLPDRASLGASIVVSCSVCEEVVEGAALGAVLDHYPANVVVIGESTDLELAIGQRGRGEILVETFGQPAHSSTPELGVNAVKSMAEVVRRFSSLEPVAHPVLGQGILEVTDILSAPYPGLSVVPEYCSATFDRRLLVGEDEATVLGTLDGALEELWGTVPNFEARLRIPESDVVTFPGTPLKAKKFAPAWLMPEEHPVVRAGLHALELAGLPPHTRTYAFCTNGSESAGRRGIPTLGFGPGSEHQAHRVDEHARFEDIVAAARGYASLAVTLSRTV